MRTLDQDWEQIRAAMPAAEDMLRRLRSPQARVFPRPEDAASVQGDLERLARSLTIEQQDALDRIRENRLSMARHLQDVEKEEAISHSSTQLNTLRSSVAVWRETKEFFETTGRQRSLLSDLNFNFVVLDTPGLILPLGDASVTATLEPWNNVAKLSSVWSFPDAVFQGGASVEFVFAWRNPSSRTVVLNVESYLTLNGFGTAAAAGGFYTPNFTDLFAFVSLLPFIDPNNPSYPPPEVGQSVYTADIVAEGGGWFGLGAVQSSAIQGAYDVTYRTLLVPGDAVAVFPVIGGAGVGATGEGWAEADFASGDFQIMCPGVVLAIL